MDLGPVTHEILVEPAEGCKPKKVHNYDDAQKAKVSKAAVYRELQRLIDFNLNRLKSCARYLSSPSSKERELMLGLIVCQIDHVG